MKAPRAPSPGDASRHCSPGFTLLEMVLVMFIVSLIVSVIFGIVSGVTQLTDDMAREQRHEARMHGFISLCNHSLRRLPSSATVRLRHQQSGSHLISQLTLVGASSPVNSSPASVTVLETEETIEGYLRLVLRSMSLKEAASWESGDKTAGVRLSLLENITELEWRVFDPRSNEWTSLWNDKLSLSQVNPPNAPAAGESVQAPIPAIRPSMVELRFSLGSGTSSRHLFWIPPAEPIRPTLTGGT